MMAEFTPGPWDISISRDGLSFKIWHYGRLIAIPQYVPGREKGDIEANARLIATAPELYEALAMLVASDLVVGWIKAQAALALVDGDSDA